MAYRKKPGIFCLEGDWFTNLYRKGSVRSLLEFLEREGRIDFIYRDIGTPGELDFYIKKWQLRKYSSFNIGYFAFHGEPEAIFIGQKRVSLDQLGVLLAGSCRGKVIYFGSCSTLGAHPDIMKEFQRVTRAKCVCGYTIDVDWFPSAAFELLLFDALTKFKRIDAVENYLKQYRSLKNLLGFKMYW